VDKEEGMDSKKEKNGRESLQSSRDATRRDENFKSSLHHWHGHQHRSNHDDDHDDDEEKRNKTNKNYVRTSLSREGIK